MSEDLERARELFHERNDEHNRRMVPVWLTFFAGFILFGCSGALFLPAQLGWIGWVPLALGISLFPLSFALAARVPEFDCPVCRKPYYHRKHHFAECPHCGTSFR